MRERLLRRYRPQATNAAPATNAGHTSQTPVRAPLVLPVLGMPATTGDDERFFASTRGKIIILLRRSSRTVKQLAEALSVTENAVRAQLTVLQRDGLIQEQTVR